MYRSLFAFLLFLLSCAPLGAQELAHTLYDFSPLQVNPAEVATSSDMALLFGNRSQRYNSDLTFNTALLSARMPIHTGTGLRRGGVGLSFYSDQSGALGELSLRSISTAFGYNLWLNKKQVISMGFSGSFYQRRISTDNITTGSQYIPNAGYDPTLDIGEDLLNLQATFMSFGAGLRWGMPDARGGYRYHLGAAAFHLNSPDDSFFGASNPVPLRLSAEGAARVLSNERIALSPGGWFLYQDGRQYYQATLTLSRFIDNTNPYDPIGNGRVDLRLGYTSTQALTVAVVFHQPYYQIALSQDIRLSNEIDLNVGGAATEVALSIRKTLGGKRKEKKGKTPSGESDPRIGTTRDLGNR